VDYFNINQLAASISGFIMERSRVMGFIKSFKHSCYEC